MLSITRIYNTLENNFKYKLLLIAIILMSYLLNFKLENNSYAAFKKNILITSHKVRATTNNKSSS